MTLKKIIKYFILTSLLVYLTIDIYIYFKFNDKNTVDSITWATKKYSSIPADSIPDNIIKAYNKVFPNSLTNKIYPDLIWFLNARNHRQNYVQLDLAYEVGHCNTIKLISIANQLDNNLTQRQCIYAYLQLYDYNDFARGIEMASKLFYNKKLIDLNDKECLELIIMTKNPTLYNKSLHQDLLDKEVEKVTGANNNQAQAAGRIRASA